MGRFSFQFRDVVLIGGALIAVGAGQTQISVNTRRLDARDIEASAAIRNGGIAHARLAEQIAALAARVSALESSTPDRRIAVVEHTTAEIRERLNAYVHQNEEIWRELAAGGRR